jgi:hypothetical protein
MFRTSKCPSSGRILHAVLWYLFQAEIVIEGYMYSLGPLMVVQWLKYCATNRKDAGSIPDGVIGIFYWYNPSDRTMALGSTQPLTEMSTRSISWEVKAAGAVVM